MILQKAFAPWSCRLTAFAMAIGVDQEVLVRRIGHDGSEIIWPQLNDPFSRRGFHLAEIIDALWPISVTPFDAMPVAASRFDSLTYTLPLNNIERMGRALEGIGVLESKLHAVAWDGSKVYDPRGKVYDIDQFAFHIFYRTRTKNESSKTNNSGEATGIM